MSIGETIKKLRTAKKLTQEELASLLGITSKAVSQWECNRTSPDISQIPALCNFFQISADQLLNINLPKSEEEKKACFLREKELRLKYADEINYYAFCQFVASKQNESTKK